MVGLNAPACSATRFQNDRRDPFLRQGAGGGNPAIPAPIMIIFTGDEGGGRGFIIPGQIVILKLSLIGYTLR